MDFLVSMGGSMITKRKIFCIGLHKTGTSSLYDFANKCGYKAIHTANWIYKDDILEEYNFFSDGGSHFDNIKEFDYAYLLKRYPNSRFILQTREPRGWIISKLKHAGWNRETEIENDDPSKLINEEWRYKSLLTIEKFLEHKHNYETRVKEYFENHDPGKLLVIDVTNANIQKYEFKRLKNFLSVDSFFDIEFPHSNKARCKQSLSDELLSFIDEKIKEIFG
jgi:hypothetical protein